MVADLVFERELEFVFLDDQAIFLRLFAESPPVQRGTLDKQQAKLKRRIDFSSVILQVAEIIFS